MGKPSTKQILDFLNDLFGPMGAVSMVAHTEEDGYNAIPHKIEEKRYFTNKDDIIQVDFVNKRRF